MAGTGWCKLPRKALERFIGRLGSVVLDLHQVGFTEVGPGCKFAVVSPKSVRNRLTSRPSVVRVESSTLFIVLLQFRQCR